MARAGLSGSEPGADLSAWLAKIMARLSGSTAPSRAVYITSDCQESKQSFGSKILEKLTVIIKNRDRNRDWVETTIRNRADTLLMANMP